jgi:hypothetical protein
MPGMPLATRKKHVSALMKAAKARGLIRGGQAGAGLWDWIKSAASKVGSFIMPALRSLGSFAKDNQLASKALTHLSQQEGAPGFLKPVSSVVGNLGYGRRMRGGLRAIKM